MIHRNITTPGKRNGKLNHNHPEQISEIIIYFEIRAFSNKFKSKQTI